MERLVAEYEQERAAAGAGYDEECAWAVLERHGLLEPRDPADHTATRAVSASAHRRADATVAA
jgi:hypothetical protein